MGRRTNAILLLLLILFFFFFLNNHFSTASITTLTRNQYITDLQTIVSSAQTFKLGFFSSGNSTNHYYYVGIWFNNIPEKTIVWVANRDTPLKDSSGVVRIADDGNLVVLDGHEKVLWTSNVSNVVPPDNNSMVELLDSGNLVLRSSNGKILWQSFDHPSNTLLRGMKFGVNLKTGIKQVITSWKDTKSDPSTGIFTLELDPAVNIPQAIIVNNSNNGRYWRSGPWNDQVFIGIPNMYNDANYFNGFSLPRDSQQGTFYLTLAFANDSALERWVLDSDGNFLQMIWDENNKQWVDSWYSRHSECDIYSTCGPYGSCNALDSPICSCLRGFEPKFKNEWSKGNWSGGCMRRTELELQCETNANGGGGGEKKSDGFLILEKMKVPDYVNWVNAEILVEGCEQMCLTNCSCIAYSFDSNIGCMGWRGDLIDIQKFSNFSQADLDLHIRVAYSELDKKKDKKKIIIITILTIGIVTISLCSYFCWWIAKQRGKKKENMKISLFGMDDGYGETLDPNVLGDNPELKILDFEMLAMATNNFSEANTLGRGGFGSVYKGKFPDGQVIAVKRLSKSSRQGLKEFKNEVLVILKLQHRNLVRLLGCCIEGEEKMLIYEFMPNKSLDFFLFDPTKRALLDWSKRIQIIEGISRGILYLHRDSRLRVIHRDLKASNILLDEELNPKISDFGMARIFGGNELEANTMRVVGTYGYMSPEYAMEGLFSEKSDVFSFGVLLLEIVSGERSTSFRLQGESLSLLGYAWQLWNDNKMKLFIDPMLLAEPLSEEEIFRCIHVGLLCVQDFANDRPTMSTTLSMLTSEIANLPTPKKPAYTEGHVTFDSSLSGKNQKSGSVNNVTITSVGGR